MAREFFADQFRAQQESYHVRMNPQITRLRTGFNRVPVLGVAHDFQIRSDVTATEKLTAEMLRRDVLLVEGTAVQTLRHTPDNQTFEEYMLMRFAQEHGDQSVIFLEEHIDRLALGKDFGLDRVTQLLGAMMPYLRHLTSSRGTILAAEPMMEDILRQLIGQLEPSYRTGVIEISTVFKQYTDAAYKAHLVGQYPELERASSLFALMVKWYMAQVRDYAVIVPGVHDLLHINSPRGSRGIMVGKAHVGNIEKGWRTGKIEQPAPWSNFVDGLGETSYAPALERMKLVVGS